MKTERSGRRLPVVLVAAGAFLTILVLRSAIFSSFVASVLVTGSACQLLMRQIRVCSISLANHASALSLSCLRRCSKTECPHKLLLASKNLRFEVIWSDGQYELPLTILSGSTSPISTIVAVSMAMVMRARSILMILRMVRVLMLMVMRHWHARQEVGRWWHPWMVGWNHAVVARQVTIFLIELKMHRMDAHSIEIAERLMTRVMRIIAAARLVLVLLVLFRPFGLRGLTF